MERRRGEPKKGFPIKENPKKVLPLEENDGDEEGVVDDGGVEEEKRRRLCSPMGGSGGGCSSSSMLRRGGGGGGGSGSGVQPCCQAEKCMADLTDAKRYHRRHKVCEVHSKAAVVVVAGLRQRFCQQCSRFHELSEFDESKRSCRRRLAGHNERRRKISSEPQGEDSSRCRQVDQNGRSQISLPGTPTYKHFQIR